MTDHWFPTTIASEGDCMPARASECVVCGQPATWQGFEEIRYECPRCGVFLVNRGMDQDLPGQLDALPIRRSIMSHVLRRMRRPDMSRLRTIPPDELSSYWKPERLPTPQQQADSLILWVGDNQPNQFEPVTPLRAALAATIGLPITPNGDANGMAWL